MSALEDQQTRGLVFNIQKYSLHDGPGIRTVVFLKGCPMTCRWCSNPESQSRLPEQAHNRDKCITLSACGRCLERCPQGAIGAGADDKALLRRERCGDCSLVCASACPSRALVVHGQERTVGDVLTSVEQDSVFYARSGGGLTLSGGEPLFQPGFALALLREAKRRRLKTALETCGFCSWPVLDEACQQVDFMIYDLKCLDSAKHQRNTGVPNEPILSNFRRMCSEHPGLSVLVRTPVIPGFNDTVEDIEAIVELLGSWPQVSYELLPYHRTAEPKYGYLGREYPLKGASLAPETKETLQAVVAARTDEATER